MASFADVLSRAMRRQMLAMACFATAGCGPVAYSVDIGVAQRAVMEARGGNAAYYAPYELAVAEAHLSKAREEAAEGAYEDAMDLAGLAKTYAKRALEISGQKSRER